MPTFGLPSSIPIKHVGPPVNLVPLRSIERRPLTTDKKYPIGQLVILDKNPSTGLIGELWYLAYFNAGNAIWKQIAVGAGVPGIDFISVDSATAPGINPVEPDVGGIVDISGTTVAAHSIPIETHTRALNSLNIEVQIASTVSPTPANTNSVGLSCYSTNQFVVDATSGMVTLKGSTGPALLTMSDDVNTLVSPSGTGNIQLVGHVVEQGATKFSTVTAGTNLLNINPMSASRWIVDSLGFNGTHTTIASALTSATSGDTIFVLPGVYTENITLKAGVNICSYSSESLTPNVTIIGKLSASFSGTCTICGIRLQTNSDYLLEVTGSNVTSVFLQNVFINASNNTAINYTSSSSSSRLSLYACDGNIGVNGAAFITSSSAGRTQIQYCYFRNTALSTTQNTFSDGILEINYTYIQSPITTSGTNTIFTKHSLHICNLINTTALTVGGSGSNDAFFTNFNGQSATDLIVNTSLNCINCTFNSANAAAVSGSGILNYTPMAFAGSSSNVTTSTQNTNVLGPRIKIGGGAELISGTSTPNTVVTAPQGSIFMRRDGSTPSTYLYTNTNGATAWSPLAAMVTGSFTPGISFGGGSTGLTYTIQEGTYTRIGNIVYFQLYILMSAVGSSTGNAKITGLPITVAGSSSQIAYCQTDNLTYPVGFTSVFLNFGTGATTADIDAARSAAAFANVTDTAFAATTAIRCNGFYFSA